jgi:hypothetical protein
MGRYRKWDCEVPLTSIKMSLCVCVCVCTCPTPPLSFHVHCTRPPSAKECACLSPVCAPCNIYMSVQHILADLAGFTCHLVTEILCSDCDVVSPILSFLQGIENSHIL